MKTTRKPNKQLRNIVLEETNDGRDVVRYLKSTFMEVEDAPRLFGLIHDDYARTHKIAAARILARIGLEEGKRYLRRNYVQTPFKRVHPEDRTCPGETWPPPHPNCTAWSKKRPTTAGTSSSASSA